VGLDIGSDSIKVVQLKPLGKGGSYQLVGFGMEPLPPEAIVDGSILDSGTVAEAIQRVFVENKIRLSDVAISLSGHSVIIKKINLPAMSPEELAESIQWEAEQYIPFDIADVNMDYQVLQSQSKEGQDVMDVLLVAVKKDKINDYLGVVNEAGKNTTVVDVDVFALLNAYEANYAPERDKAVALVNIGSAVTNIGIVENGQPVFWRDVTVGGQLYSEAIQRELGLSYDQAESLKRGVQVEGVSLHSAVPVLQSVSEEIGAEVEKTLNFFKTTSSCERIDKIFLSGGAARTINLDQYLGERFNTEVDFLNPFREVKFTPKQFDGDYLEEVAPSAAVAVGLALRKAGDK
jgi:type IV pilus assembly protein PilM